MTIIFTLSSQFVKDTFNSLTNCKANFRYVSYSNQFEIKEVTRITLSTSVGLKEYGIDFKIMGNEMCNMIFIPGDRVTEFEVTQP